MRDRRLMIERELKDLGDELRWLTLLLKQLGECEYTPEVKAEIDRTELDIEDKEFEMQRLGFILSEILDDYIPDEGAPLH